MSDNKKVKVLFITRWYPNKHDPMWGLFVERHARAVSGFCDTVVLYVHQDESIKKCEYLIESTLNNNFSEVRVYYKKSRIPLLKSIINIFRYLKSNFIGLKHIRTRFGKPDLVHVNILTRCGLIALSLKYFKKIPFVITEHWTRYLPVSRTYKGFLRKLLSKLVVKKASAVMPVTDNLKDAMISCGLKNNNYKVIPNVVNTENFIPAEKNTDRNKKRIIHISCFDDKQKNISGMIRVIKKLSLQRTDFEFRLVGDGHDKTKMEQYAEGLGIKNNFVFFDGLKVENDLINSLRNSDFFLMFSNYENLPVVILESYACGIPVISTDTGGIHEYLNNDLGLLVKPGDENDLLHKINYMLDNLDIYDKEKIRHYAVMHFSDEVIGKNISDIYRKVLSGNLNDAVYHALPTVH